MNEKISEHLNAALEHLQDALRLSVDSVLQDPSRKRAAGAMWEGFLGRFFAMIKMQSKEHNFNILSWISLPKLWKG